MEKEIKSVSKTIHEILTINFMKYYFLIQIALVLIGEIDIR